MTTSDKCPDCQVSPGTQHSDGCDVARCKLHGFQWISCSECLDRLDTDPSIQDAQPTVWTGEWPGILECREFGYATYDFPGMPGWTEDLNRLGWEGATGKLKWDSENERWVKL